MQVPSLRVRDAAFALAIAVSAAGGCANGSSDTADPDGGGALGDAMIDAPDDTSSGDATAPADVGTPDSGAPLDAAHNDDSASDDTGVTDAGSDSSADVTGDSGASGGCDAATPAVIPPSGFDTFTPGPNVHWVTTGTANIDVTEAGWASLTADTSGQVGAIWWNAAYTFDAFTVQFTVKIQNKSSGADGVAFAWIPGNDVTTVGMGGSGYGFGGQSGWGVAIDTYQNSGEPTAPFLTIVDPTGKQLVQPAIPNIRDGSGHTVKVQLLAGSITVWIDGVSYIAGFALQNYTPFSGHWGFVAATGNNSEAHEVTAISMTFPNGQGCVP